MKFVYVLISSDTDLYFEQMLISIISLRKFNNDADIYILVDKETADSFVDKRNMIKDLATVITVDVPTEMNKKARSRWLKTSINKYIEGSFLFIDCDTVICDSLKEIEGYENGVYCVLDKHLELPNHRNSKTIKYNTKQLGFSAAFEFDKHFNSGIILFIDCKESQDLFNKWHELWKYSYKNKILIDQPAFNEANLKLNKIIKELPGIWNCQISDNGLPYLSESKIIHYFASNLVRYKSPYIFADKEIYKKIRTNELSMSNIEKLLENPRSSFLRESKIISDPAELEMFTSFPGRCLARFFKYLNN